MNKLSASLVVCFGLVNTLLADHDFTGLSSDGIPVPHLETRAKVFIRDWAANVQVSMTYSTGRHANKAFDFVMPIPASYVIHGLGVTGINGKKSESTLHEDHGSKSETNSMGVCKLTDTSRVGSNLSNEVDVVRISMRGSTNHSVTVSLRYVLPLTFVSGATTSKLPFSLPDVFYPKCHNFTGDNISAKEFAERGNVADHFLHITQCIEQQVYAVEMEGVFSSPAGLPGNYNLSSTSFSITNKTVHATGIAANLSFRGPLSNISEVFVLEGFQMEPTHTLYENQIGGQATTRPLNYSIWFRYPLSIGCYDWTLERNPSYTSPNDEYWFLLDRSTSMNLFSHIQTAQAALGYSMYKLEIDSAQFNLISFDGKFQQFFDREQVPNSKENLNKALVEFFAKTVANASSENLPKLLRYLYDKPRNNSDGIRFIILATDGLFSNSDEILRLAQENSNKSRIYVFSVGSNPIGMTFAEELGKVSRGAHVRAPFYDGNFQMTPDVELMRYTRFAMRDSVRRLQRHTRAPASEGLLTTKSSKLSFQPIAGFDTVTYTILRELSQKVPELFRNPFHFLAAKAELNRLEDEYFKLGRREARLRAEELSLATNVSCAFTERVFSEPNMRIKEGGPNYYRYDRNVGYNGNDGKPSNPAKSVNGVVRQNEFPWMARLILKDASGNSVNQCDGVILDKEWILTPADCIANSESAMVLLGRHDIAERGSEHGPLSKRANLGAVVDDLALYNMENPLQGFTNQIKPIRLPDELWVKTDLDVNGNYSIDSCEELVLAGWTLRRFHGKMTKRVMSPRNIEDCTGNDSLQSKYVDYAIRKRKFCAAQTHPSACGNNTSAGSPVMCLVNSHWYLIGLSQLYNESQCQQGLRPRLFHRVAPWLRLIRHYVGCPKFDKGSSDSEGSNDIRKGTPSTLPNYGEVVGLQQPNGSFSMTPKFVRALRFSSIRSERQLREVLKSSLHHSWSSMSNLLWLQATVIVIAVFRLSYPERYHEWQRLEQKAVGLVLGAGISVDEFDDMVMRVGQVLSLDCCDLSALCETHPDKITLSSGDRTCSEPPEVLNGRISTMSYLIAPGCGERVTYNCSNGFTVVGNATITCRNGTWSAPPVCQYQSCQQDPPDLPANVMVLYRRTSGSAEYPALIRLKCRYGFDRLVGRTIALCRRNGSWTELPRCIGNFHRVTTISSTTDAIQHTTEHNVSISSTTAVHQTTEHNKRQTQMLCPLAPIENGTVILLYRPWGTVESERQVPVGMRIRISCADTFKPSASVNESVCDMQGIWHPNIPRCLATEQQRTHTVNDRTDIVCGISTFRSWSAENEAVDAGEFPWMARLSVQYVNSSNSLTEKTCGGTLISNQWVLTTADCLSTYQPFLKLDVILGRINFTLVNGIHEQSFSANSTHIHPDFSGSDFGRYDFGLVKLNAPATFTAAVRPICLPEGMCRNNGNSIFISCSSFGALRWKTFRGSPPYLNKIELENVRKGRCQQIARNRGKTVVVNESQFCALEASSGVGKCNERGNPVICVKRRNHRRRAYLIGVTSTRIDDECSRRNPIVSGSVCSALSWIHNTMRKY